MKTLMSGFSTGFLAPIRGLRIVVGPPRVRRLAILPFVISFLVLVSGLFLALPPLLSLLPGWVTSFLGLVGLASASVAAQALYWVILVFLWPAAFIALLYLLFVVTKLLSAPFYALLAERVLIEAGVLEDLPFQLGSWLRLNARMLVISVVKSILFLLIGLILFLLSFIPGVAILTGFCFLLIVVFDLADYSFEALQMGLGERLRFFRDNIWVFSGFAMAMGLVFFIPGLNFILLPASVAGGGDVVRRLIGAKQMSSV